MATRTTRIDWNKVFKLHPEEGTTRRCALCNERHNVENMTKFGYYWLCKECFNRNVTKCEKCGREVWSHDIGTVNDINMCSRCFREKYRYCDYCGKVELIDDLNEVRDGYVCDDCLSSYYTYCDECEEYVRSSWYNSEAEMCENCARENGRYLISGYHSHTYHFIGNYDEKRNIWYKGIELEIDDGNNADRCARDIHKAINCDKEHLFFETDGSLNNGVEIISHAHLINDNSIDWAKVMDIAKEYNFKSHDGGTCGLHLHYDRNFFGKNSAQREYNIGKLIAFYETYFDDFLKASRRTESQYENWARRYYASSGKECSKIAKNSDGYARYHAVNLTKRNTIEFRLGRGTLNIDTFNAWNDLHDCLVKNIKKCSYKDIYSDNNVAKFLKGIKPETVEYLHSRGAFMALSV